MQSPSTQEVEIALRDHQIGFVLNEGEQVLGHLVLKKGALIHGYVDGGIECEVGSVIITETGSVKGSITGDRVLVEGSVKSHSELRSKVIGRELITISSMASVDADLFSKAFSLHSKSIQGALHTLS